MYLYWRMSRYRQSSSSFIAVVISSLIAIDCDTRCRINRSRSTSSSNLWGSFVDDTVSLSSAEVILVSLSYTSWRSFSRESIRWSAFMYRRSHCFVVVLLHLPDSTVYPVVVDIVLRKTFALLGILWVYSGPIITIVQALPQCSLVWFHVWQFLPVICCQPNLI